MKLKFEGKVTVPGVLRRGREGEHAFGEGEGVSMGE